MGEAKRKRQRAIVTQALEAIRETLWTLMADSAERLGCERGDLLALLLERAMLLGGLTEAESDRFVTRMEQIEAALDAQREADMLGQLAGIAENLAEPTPAPRQGPPDAPTDAARADKRPIDPAYMAALEAMGQRLAATIGGVVDGTGLGFLLMLFGIGDRSELTYLTNCNRGDVLAMLREYIPILEQRLDAPPGVLSRPLN